VPPDSSLIQTGVAVLRLTLTDFRNYASLRIEPRARFVVLVGANGAGKTNLLEAISMLALGRGLRGAEFESLARLHAEPKRWAVAAHLQTSHGATEIGTAWEKPVSELDQTIAQTGNQTGTRSRTVAIDGMPQKSAGALAGRVSMSWLTPAMDRLFQGPPADRRRFLDRMTALLFPDHASHVAVFERLMRERNALLAESSFDTNWAQSLELQMAETAIAIAHARMEATSDISTFFGTEDRTGQFPWGQLALDGDIERSLQQLSALQAEETYRTSLARNRNADRAAGRTLSGPHRTDMTVTHGPKSMPAGLCSTGEQKALLIGLVLAQARAVRKACGTSPMLLLDEIAAHLDKTRRTGLFQQLDDLGSQVWMTGTDIQFFDGIQGSGVVYGVENGTLSESIF
jgi:DNA replication and repair protein RecF